MVNEWNAFNMRKHIPSYQKTSIETGIKFQFHTVLGQLTCWNSGK